MIKQMVLAFALAFGGIASASALEIQVDGVGKAEAPATRAYLGLMDFTAFSMADLEAVPAPVAKPANKITSDKTLDIIRRVDATAKMVPTSRMSDLTYMAPMLSSADAYDIASAKADAIWNALTSEYGASMRPLLTPIADDPAELKQIALKLALADAETNARETARAAGMKLGPMRRITRSFDNSALISVVAAPELFAPPSEMSKSARAHISVTVTYEAIP